MIDHVNWLCSANGRSLLREESRQVAAALESIFGDYFLQIGVWGEPGIFRSHARTRRTVVVATTPAPGIDGVTATTDLAIASDSVDAVLLPHTLETADDPHAVLREVDRVLRPDGHMIALGFNPMGWWGVRHYLSRRGFPAGIQRLISERRLQDWLRLLKFTVHLQAWYHHVPPVYGDPGPAVDPADAGSTEGDAARGRGLPPMFHYPILAGCYILVARKEGYVVTPIRPAFKRPAQLVGGLVNPTTRNAA